MTIPTVDEQLRRQVDTMRAELDRLAGLPLRVEDLEHDIHGEDRRGFVGLRKRLDIVQTLAESIAKERTAERNKMLGVMVGLGLQTLISGGTLVAVIRLIWGA